MMLLLSLLLLFCSSDSESVSDGNVSPDHTPHHAIPTGSADSGSAESAERGGRGRRLDWTAQKLVRTAERRAGLQCWHGNS